MFSHARDIHFKLMLNVHLSKCRKREKKTFFAQFSLIFLLASICAYVVSILWSFARSDSSIQNTRDQQCRDISDIFPSFSNLTQSQSNETLSFLT